MKGEDNTCIPRKSIEINQMLQKKIKTRLTWLSRDQS